MDTLLMLVVLEERRMSSSSMSMVLVLALLSLVECKGWNNCGNEIIPPRLMRFVPRDVDDDGRAGPLVKEET